MTLKIIRVSSAKVSPRVSSCRVALPLFGSANCGKKCLKEGRHLAIEHVRRLTLKEDTPEHCRRSLARDAQALFAYQRPYP